MPMTARAAWSPIGAEDRMCSSSDDPSTDAFVLVASVADAGAPAQLDPARVGSVPVGQQLEQRGLAGAVEAHDQHALAAADAEGDVVEDVQVAVGLGEGVRLELRCGRTPAGPAVAPRWSDDVRVR